MVRVPLAERPAALDGNLENLEVAWRNRHPAAAAVIGALAVRVERPADDAERQAVAALERHAARRAGFDNAWDRLHTRDAVAHELLDGLRTFVRRSFQRHPQRQYAVRVEPGIDAAEGGRRANQERRADEQHERERHLDDDQYGARIVLPGAGPEPAALLFDG